MFYIIFCLKVCTSNLLNELRKEIKCEACRAFIVFLNEFYSIIDARMLDSIYHMTLNVTMLFCHIYATLSWASLNRDYYMAISIFYPISTLSEGARIAAFVNSTLYYVDMKVVIHVP